MNKFSLWTCSHFQCNWNLLHFFFYLNTCLVVVFVVIFSCLFRVFSIDQWTEVFSVKMADCYNIIGAVALLTWSSYSILTRCIARWAAINGMHLCAHCGRKVCGRMQRQCQPVFRLRHTINLIIFISFRRCYIQFILALN